MSDKKTEEKREIDLKSRDREKRPSARFKIACCDRCDLVRDPERMGPPRMNKVACLSCGHEGIS